MDFFLIKRVTNMNAHHNLSLDEKHSLTIHTSNDGTGMQEIKFIKKGHGEQTTTRPLGAVRLELALDEANMTQTDLAKKIGVNQPTISRIVDGKTKNSRYLPLIAKVLNKNINWLSGIEPADKNNASVNNNLLDIDGNLFIIVTKYAKEHDDSKTAITENIIEPPPVIISRDYLGECSDHKKLKYICEAERGMNPDIKIGSPVVFDTLDTSVTNGDIYVVEYGDSTCSRILFKQPNGNILVHAKEADFPGYEIKPGDDSFKILGRVIQITNKT